MEVLVIGLGSMGRRRIRLLKRFEQIENIIGIDGRKDRRNEAREMFGCITHESIEIAMQANPQASCVFVCTSPLSHSALIAEALGNGLHVFTEINLVSDGYEENMVLAESKGKVLFLSSTFYYREEIQFIRKGIQGKTNINYVYHIGQYLPNWHPWENYKDFFVGDKRTNGCREIMAIEFPWIIGTFGTVKKLHVLSDNMSKLHIPYKDNYLIQMEHESGNKGVLVVDVVSPKAVRNLEVYGENIYYSWNGSPTSLEYFDESERTLKPVQLYENIEHMNGYSSFVVENAYQNEIRAFLDVVQGKTTPQYGFKEDLEILNLIDQIEGICHE